MHLVEIVWKTTYVVESVNGIRIAVIGNDADEFCEGLFRVDASGGFTSGANAWVRERAP